MSTAGEGAADREALALEALGRGAHREHRTGDRVGLAVYRLTPHTGRTHQLRLHLHGLGIPIVGDPLYPEVLDVSVDDFSNPLQLLASTIELVDPVDGRERRFVSGWTLPIAPPA